LNLYVNALLTVSGFDHKTSFTDHMICFPPMVIKRPVKTRMRKPLFLLNRFKTEKNVSSFRKKDPEGGSHRGETWSVFGGKDPHLIRIQFS